MFTKADKQELLDEIAELRGEIAALRGERAAIRDELGLSEKVIDLRKTIETLTIERDRTKETNARTLREVEHKVGLERQRQEVEVAQAKRDAVLAVREETLKADQRRFADEMKFQRERFESEVGYLKDLMGQILERLPNVSAQLTVPVERARAVKKAS